MFGNSDYLKLLHLLATSAFLFGDIHNNNVHFLVITTENFRDSIKDIFNRLHLHIHIMCIEINNEYIALSARLYIFNYSEIHNYHKILYIDTDILITNKVSILFDLALENKIYTLMEGIIGDQWHGYEYFDFSTINRETPGFTSGIILFNNCDEVRDLFNLIISNIINNIHNNGIKSIAYDQAFINYYAITTNKYNNTLLCNYTVNNPSEMNYKYVICHFPGGVGDYRSKSEKMNCFLLHMYDSFNFN
jgi:lipopolysaccharide biosynthesis glycosyltransferase